MPEDVRSFIVDRFREGVEERVPHNRALGLRLEAFDGRRLHVRLPYDPALVGNTVLGVLHGGAITALVDATCGVAVFAKLMKPLRVATLDLRIDYLRPATPGKDVIARAECIKTTRSVAFVRCEAYHPGDESDYVAIGNGTFMIFRGEERQKAGGA